MFGCVHERTLLTLLQSTLLGISSGISLTTTTAPRANTAEEARRPSQSEKPLVDFQALIESLRAGLGPIARSDMTASQASNEVAGGGREGQGGVHYDSLKLAVFRHDKLGISLIRVSSLPIY